MNGDGQEVPCCAWAPDAWVPPYMSLASVMLLWTVFLFGQFRIFTISGTVAQWSAPLSCCHPALPALLWASRDHASPCTHTAAADGQQLLYCSHLRLAMYVSSRGGSVPQIPKCNV